MAESEDEPYTFAISLALNGLKETSTFNAFLTSVCKGFLIQAEKILEQMTALSDDMIWDHPNTFKLSSSFLILQRFFMAVPEVHKKCIIDEVTGSGKDFLKHLFIVGRKTP